MNKDNEEWQALHCSLTGSLALLGREDPYGEGDYWIVDDDYGKREQKICVQSENILHGEMVYLIQKILQNFLNWSVLIQIDFEIEDMPATTGGFRISSSNIVYQLNPRALQTVKKMLS